MRSRRSTFLLDGRTYTRQGETSSQKRVYLLNWITQRSNLSTKKEQYTKVLVCGVVVDVNDVVNSPSP